MLESYLEKVVNLGEYYLTQSTLFWPGLYRRKLRGTFPYIFLSHYSFPPCHLLFSSSFFASYPSTTQPFASPLLPHCWNFSCGSYDSCRNCRNYSLTGLRILRILWTPTDRILRLPSLYI
jgi:hypothetical protein